MTCLDDATVLGLVEGRLAAEVIAQVDEHIDTCASCREVVTLVAGSRSAGRVLARGDTIDRYVIGDLLGAGAMGRVYSAWEPELDRRVAIKVLREEEGARDRLVKEAQAMARLDHPNVIGVHEVGSTDEGVFVAMELVEGDSLRAWAQTERPWREIVRVLIDVARGLAAVHAAGVVHRDVKPDNVIVGADGRVRLGDFGLARSGPGTSAAPPVFAVGTLSTGTAVAGTPAYMAPEVLRGGAATAASDQFSFGVLAYELLAGKRPFAGATWSDLLAAIEADDVRPLRARDVPSWLDDVIRRCIAVDPARRFSSLKDVADRLAERAVRRSPTVWLAAILAGALVASGATWFAVRDTRKASASCAIGEAELAGTWNAGVRSQLAAKGVTPSALAAIDRWTRSWIDERNATCRSARQEPPARIASRERCLVLRREEVAAVLALAPKSPDRVADVFASLAPADECRAADADPLPIDPTQRDAARHIQEGLPRLRAAIALDTLSNAASKSEALVDAARKSEHAPTLADTLLVHAEALRAADRIPDAAVAARDAVAAAERGHADLLRARAWLLRVAIAGDQRDLAAAEELAAIAHATIDRIGSPHLAASLARIRGLIAYNRGDLDAARAYLVNARNRFIALSGERTLDIAAVDSALGSVARAAGDLVEAQRYHESVLELDRELRGDKHRDIARDLHNVAGVLRLRGFLDEALATYREALVIEIAMQGERSVAAALTHNSIGLVELARALDQRARTNERPDLATKVDYQAFFVALARAKHEFEIARTIFTETNHGDLAFAEHNLGLVAQARADHKTALEHFSRAQLIYAKTIGADAPAAVRLIDDRAISERAVRPAKIATARPAPTPSAETKQVTTPVTPPTDVGKLKLPEVGQPKRDVGVYGSAQSW